jgi:uncharacterized protein YraI
VKNLRVVPCLALLSIIVSACAPSPQAMPPTPTAPSVPPTTIPSATVTATQLVSLTGCSNTRSTLRLRKEPNTQAEIISGIPAASCFTVFGYNGDQSWLRVTFEQDEGWVAAQYVDIQGETSRLPTLAQSGLTDLFATVDTEHITAQASSPTPPATYTSAPPPTNPPVKAPTPYAQPTQAVLLCSRTAAYVSQQVTCKIPRAYCSYQPATSGSPTFCNDAPYPSNSFALVVWDQDWSDYDGKCIVVSGLVSIYRGKPQIEVSSRSQVVYCW